MEIKDQEEVLTRLKKVQKALKLKSVRSFAIKADVDPSLFDKILKGQKPVTENILQNLEERANVNSAWLLSGTGDMLFHHNTPQNSNPVEFNAIDYKDRYIKLLEEREEERKKPGNLPGLNSGASADGSNVAASLEDIKRILLTNQAVLESLYMELVKDSKKDKSLIERMAKTLQEGNG